MSITELEWKRWRMKTTFQTRYEHYKYTVMSFKLKTLSLSFKNNQWHVERISQWLCDHISE
jgi:hypothetical protein